MASNPTSMSEEERAALLLEPGYSMQLATIGSNGYPHLSAMWYIYTRGHMYFNTYGTSQKGLNMARDPRVSCMVEVGKQYTQLRGVVIQGKVVQVTDAEEFEVVSMALIRRYPMASPELKPEQVFEQVKRTTKRLLYRVEAEHIYSWDHSKAPARQPRKPQAPMP